MWRDDAWLLDMVLAAKKSLKYTHRVSRASFGQNEILQDAVMRQLEIIGEAANKISSEMQDEHPDIPWSEIIGMRNRLVHEYFRIDLDKVWETVRKDVPKLLKKIEPLLQPEHK